MLLSKPISNQSPDLITTKLLEEGGVRRLGGLNLNAAASDLWKSLREITISRRIRPNQTKPNYERLDTNN